MRLPPLNALLAFYVAAKHESFLKAAESQHVTAGAISRQVKKLEQHFGIDLFVRTTRAVTLTEVGKELLSSLDATFSQLHADTQRIASRAQMPIRLRCSMLCMRHWLMPRLPVLYEQLPEANVTFSVARAADVMGPDMDCAIRLGNGTWKDLSAEYLMSARMVPVCSPAFAKGLGEITSISDLASQKLIHAWHSGHLPDHWKSWLGADLEKILPTAQKVTLQGEGLAYQAAQEGMGIALGRVSLLVDDLQAGRLASLLEPRAQLDLDYYIVYPEKSRRTAGFNELRNWLLAQGRETDQRASAHFGEPH